MPETMLNPFPYQPQLILRAMLGNSFYMIISPFYKMKN